MGGMFHKEQSVGVIGQYQLLELLARTDSTELYRARRGTAKEPLVLKLYVDEDPERDRRLVRAIQILLRLTHPAILPLQDWGTDGTRHYLVTEPQGKPLEIPAGGATMVDFKVEVPGTYILVDHALTRAIDRGAAGLLIVTGDDNPDVFQGVSGAGSGH